MVLVKRCNERAIWQLLGNSYLTSKETLEKQALPAPAVVIFGCGTWTLDDMVHSMDVSLSKLWSW